MKNNINHNKLIKIILSGMLLVMICINKTKGSQNQLGGTPSFEEAYHNFIIRPLRLKIVELDIKTLEQPEPIQDPIKDKYAKRQEDWRSLMSALYQQVYKVMHSENLDVAWHVALRTFKKQFWGFHFEDVPLSVDTWITEYNFISTLAREGQTFDLQESYYPVLLGFFKKLTQTKGQQEHFETSER